MPKKSDVAMIRDLAARVAEIAALPVQEEKRSLWRKLNALKPERTMVMVDEVCWTEFRAFDELRPRCEDRECRDWERHLRRTLFQWEHFPVDMVVEPIAWVPKAFGFNWFGMQVQEETVATDPTNNIVAHKYVNQFEKDDDLEKIQKPVVWKMEDETERRMTVANELFDGLLEVRELGANFPMTFWDLIATLMGVENALWALVDRPEFVHKLLARMTGAFVQTLDQLEEQGLLCGPQSIVHCTGGWTDQLPASGYDPEKPRTQDIWMMGWAQMLGTVSPRMFREFEIDYVIGIAERFGLVYYGCCEPLDNKMELVRQIPNVRKVSMSPWVNQERGAAAIGRDYVFSRKPNPALLAFDDFDAAAVQKDLESTRAICAREGCPLEIILKDISTLRHEPERLFSWGEIAMETVQR
jgi:hypothetical protein